MTSRSLTLICTVLVALLAPRLARAIPRFAARNSMECIQCHYDPTGGGVRNRYGSGVFGRALLPLQVNVAAPEDDSGRPQEVSTWLPTFSGVLTDWLTLGADVRLGYLLSVPDRGQSPMTSPSVLNSFFLMQADLYHAATLNPHVNLVIDVGVYTGFEAWGLLKASAAPGPVNLMIRAGRFKPAFGVRESNHTIFTREQVGFGPLDQDTGVELTLYAWGLTINTAVVNGTFGGAFFDSWGTDRRTFEKALVSRASYRLLFDAFHLQIGGSVYLNQNVDTQNPIFNDSVPMPPAGTTSPVAQGLDELRAGPFLMASLGRFTYIADAVYVRDVFNSVMLSPLRAYAAYQELSFVPFQGLDVVATMEIKNGNLDAPGHHALRFGLVAELFPFANGAVRVMVREMRVDAPNPNVTDLTVFLHAYL
jgi:hypothetical protein